MDHLLYPLSKGIPSLQVPFLCGDEDEYDGRSFATFPCRKGWADPSNSLRWLQCSDDELARRVQTWLYFGLLSAFCGNTIARASLCRIDELTGSHYLSTTKLHHYLDKRENSESRRTLLREAFYCSQLVEQRVTSNLGPLSLISCSVRVLLQTMNSTQGLQVQTINSTQRYHNGQRWPLKWSEGLFDGWHISPAKAIMYRMEALGWCPAKILDFSQRYSCSMLYYLSGLPVEQGVHHTQCTELACSAYNIDESNYNPRHTKTCGGQNCSLVEATTLAVASIIEDDFGIPLMSCSIDPSGRILSELVRAEPHLEYIAISHVWSGGLGNPNQNGLPECQIRALMHHVRHLQRLTSRRNGIMNRVDAEKGVLFWMDTFCIPVGKDFKPARRKAVDSMAPVYSGASAVLVLDPELQNFSYRNLEMEQALALALRSSWMSRCWTLQEASLSRSWFVQFKDYPVNLANAAKQSGEKSTIDFFIGRGKLLPSIRRALVAELSRFLIDMGEVRYQRRGRYSRSEIWNLKQLESHQALSFATAWNNFQGRTTSKSEDLHQILAGMADIQAGGLRPLALEDRMKAILKGHASLPIDLLFCPCERLHGDDPANTWAPRFPQGGRLDETFGNMKVFTDCLFISSKTSSRYLQVCFGRCRTLMADRFQVDIPTTGRVWIEINGSKPDQDRDVADSTICLIFPIIAPRSTAKIWSESLGARFIVQKQEGQDLHISYDCPFRVYGYDRGNVDSRSCRLSSEAYPYTPVKLVRSHSRIFIDSGKSSILLIYLHFHQESELTWIQRSTPGLQCRFFMTLSKALFGPSQLHIFCN